MDFDNPKAYGDTFISNGLVNNVAGSNASMKVAILQYKLVQFHAWSVNQRLSQLSLKHFITSKSDNEILKQSSSFEQSQLF